MPLLAQLNDEIKVAMKAKDKDRLSVIRMVKSKVMTADPRGEFSDEEVLKLIASYGKSLKDSIKQFQELSKSEEVEACQRELAIVEEFLPKSLSEAETKALVEQLVKEVDAQSRKDMGKVMKAVFGSGKTVDGALVKKAFEEIIPA